jgi:GntR family transcriptional regulator/MocR family aminotransferase
VPAGSSRAEKGHGLVLGFTNIASAEQASTVALRLAQIIQGSEIFKSGRLLPLAIGG